MIKSIGVKIPDLLKGFMKVHGRNSLKKVIRDKGMIKPLYALKSDVIEFATYLALHFGAW